VTGEPPIVDVVAAWIVTEVKRTLIEGPSGELRLEEWFDEVSALTEEFLDEDALFQLAREQVGEALGPVIRQVIRRALEDINQLP
jgi:hypothetical protein